MFARVLVISQNVNNINTIQLLLDISIFLDVFPSTFNYYKYSGAKNFKDKDLITLQKLFEKNFLRFVDKSTL